MTRGMKVKMDSNADNGTEEDPDYLPLRERAEGIRGKRHR